jgi:predicted nucleic acid-binding protein
VTFLVDTNVIAELRKGSRANANVRAWFETPDPDAIALSVLTIGEIRRGIENLRRREPMTARAIERWLHRLIADHAERIVSINEAVAEQWGRLNAPDPVPVIDGLLARDGSGSWVHARDSEPT